MNDWIGLADPRPWLPDGWTLPATETIQAHQGITVVQSAPWLFGALCTAGLLLIGGGWLCRRELGWLGQTLCLVTGCLLLGVLAPGALLDMVSVHPEGLRVTQVRWAGECLAPAQFELNFQGLSQLELVESPRRGMMSLLGGDSYLVGRTAQGSERWLPLTRLARPVLDEARAAAQARHIVWVDRYDRWLTTTTSGGPASAAENR